MNLQRQVLLTLHFVKLRRFLGSLFYPLQRDWFELRSRSHNMEVTEETGGAEKGKPIQCGGHFYFKHLELEVTFLATDLIRVDWQPGKVPLPYGIARKDWEEVEIDFQDKENCWIISSSALKVIINADGSLQFQNSLGQTIREELPPQRRVKLSDTAKGEGWIIKAKLKSDECIYGLGERAAPLNLRTGQKQIYRMWNSDRPGKYGPGDDPLYLCIPTYISLSQNESYLVFYENSFRANFTFTDVATAEFEDGALRYYFTSGSLQQLLERYTELTGRPPLPPRWALGYHQSRWGYETEEEVRKTAQGFQTYNLPLSAIHLDIDCQKEFRAFTIDPDRFPKLTEFSRELASLGVRLIAINSPGVKVDPKSKLFLEGKLQEVFCRRADGKLVTAPVWAGMCAFPDFTNPLARHWWSRQYEYLLDLGITGFWHDMNEPAVLVLWGDRTLPARTTLHYMEGRGGDHREAHNVYGLLQAEAAYEALRGYQPQRRPFIVSRSGWAGLQRYAWTWTGDVETSWEGLRQTIPTVLNMGLSGIPYTGPDIGGFKGDPSAELYLRWFQMACFLPFCRTHCADNAKPRTPWSYDEPTLNTIREFLQLRYRLMPYFYTLAWQATKTGHPLIRPLFWADTQDSQLWSIEDEFLVGDALLVCPIVSEGATARSVTLPTGYWYNYWNDTLLDGGKQIDSEAPRQQIPLFIKAGSIIPMEEGEKLILHIYPPVKNNFQDNQCGDMESSNITTSSYLYSDGGDGYGESRLDYLRMIFDSKTLHLVREEQGNFTFPYTTIKLHLHGVEIRQVWIDGKEANYEGKVLQCNYFQEIRVQGDFDSIKPQNQILATH